jgi:hypothetical protein
MDDREIEDRFPAGTKFFSRSRRLDCFRIPPNQLSTQGEKVTISPGVKRLEREADEPPPSSAEVKDT